MSDRLVIFDFDGVIADSFDVAYGFYERYAPGQVTADEYRTWFNGNILAMEGKRKSTRHLLPPTDAYHVEYAERLLPTPPFPGIADTIHTLADQYLLSILSSNRLNVIDSYLTKYQLREYFDEILDRDTSRSKVEKLQILLRDHQTVPSHAVFITDTLGDILEAHEVGIETVAVSWGFHTRARLEPGKPFDIVDKPSEILPTIQRYFASQ